MYDEDWGLCHKTSWTVYYRARNGGRLLQVTLFLHDCMSLVMRKPTFFA